MIVSNVFTFCKDLGWLLSGGVRKQDIFFQYSSENMETLEALEEPIWDLVVSVKANGNTNGNRSSKWKHAI